MHGILNGMPLHPQGIQPSLTYCLDETNGCQVFPLVLTAGTFHESEKANDIHRLLVGSVRAVAVTGPSRGKVATERTGSRDVGGGPVASRYPDGDPMRIATFNVNSVNARLPVL